MHSRRFISIKVLAADEGGVKRLWVGGHLFESIEQVADFINAEHSDKDEAIAVELNVIFGNSNEIKGVLG